MKKIALIGIIVLILVALGIVLLYDVSKAPEVPETPEIPVLPDGQFPTPSHSLIEVTSPRPNAEVSSPIKVSGKARGYWFFEASFPVRVLDGDGNIIGLGIAQAQGEWMTEDFVPFEGTITFSDQRFEKGTIVFSKDNPSGLPENDDEFRVPVLFKKDSNQTNSGNKCYVGGCSGQICSDQIGVITTCEYQPQYACYKNAKCERQQGGACGWSQTSALVSCLQNPPPLQ